MPNNKEFLSDLELEGRLSSMNDRELLEFTARQVYDVCGVVARHEKRIGNIEGRSNKIVGIAGGAGTFIGASITALINYFVNR